MKRFIVLNLAVWCILWLIGLENCNPKSGVIVHKEGTMDGYTLISTFNRDNTPLIDMEGREVHNWPQMHYPAKLLPGGGILGSRRFNETVPNSTLESIEFNQQNWDGQELWFFTNWDNYGTGIMMSREHHDYQREGNPVGYYAPGQEALLQGKTLILAHKNKSVPEISDKDLIDDVIYEVNWAGELTGFVWQAADHFEEFGFDEDAKAGIYLNPNYYIEAGFGDWLHINSISELGQNHWYDEGDVRFHPKNIIFGSRNSNFLAIIDRQTGSIVWRVGPDYSEGMPEYELGQFQGQHHVHMIPKGLPGAGNILVFDNGGESGYGGPIGYPEFPPRGYSRVVEFNPITLKIVWEYGPKEEGNQFYSNYISSAQRLPNGNTLICEGTSNRVFEVTADKKVVWDYRPAFTTIEGFYRAYRIPPDWLPQGFNPSGYPNWSEMF